MVVACRTLLALVFLESFVGKVRSGRAFAQFNTSLRNLRLVPAAKVRNTAIAVVAAEGAVPVLLAIPGATIAGFALAGSLLAAFIGAIAASMRRGTTAPCPCFGGSAAPLGIRHIARNLLLLAAAAAGALAAWGGGHGDAEAAGIVIAVLAAVVGGAIVLRMDDLIDLFAEPTAAAGRPSRKP